MIRGVDCWRTSVLHPRGRPDLIQLEPDAENPRAGPGVPSTEPRTLPVALVTAVALELEPLAREIGDPEYLSLSGRPGFRARIDGVPILALAGGMGKVNAAHALTVLLERTQVSAVVNFGVAGAYVGAGLAPGQLVLATSEVYGDEGAAAPGGWISTEEIGIPLVDRGGVNRFNHFPLEEWLVSAAADRLESHEMPVARGPFVTVSCCSGTAERGGELRRRFAAVCETMEGAACAHICSLYDVPFLEVRGVSNLVEDRDLSRWKLQAAAASAARAAHLLVPLIAESVRLPGSR
jgi:futalosine hydrolase